MNWMKRIRLALQLEKKYRQVRRERFPLMSLELANEGLTEQEILLACFRRTHIENSELGFIVEQLCMRRDRQGKLTVEQALDLYEANVLSIRSEL